MLLTEDLYRQPAPGSTVKVPVSNPHMRAHWCKEEIYNFYSRAFQFRTCCEHSFHIFKYVILPLPTKLEDPLPGTGTVFCRPRNGKLYQIKA